MLSEHHRFILCVGIYLCFHRLLHPLHILFPMGRQPPEELEFVGSTTPSDEYERVRTSQVAQPDPPNSDGRPELTLRGVLAHLGPAFLVSIGYLDPGNWATDIEGGSRFGYQLLWVLVAANAMALLLQTLAARMGIVTRAHLAELCREEYPRAATLLLWVMAEFAIIATDLTEVLGTAIGINLLFHVPLMLGVLITVLDTFLLLAAQSNGMRRVEQIIFVFLGIISFCFIAELTMSDADPVAIARGVFVPSLSAQSLYVATGIVGATVMPHNFYLHSALVIERVPDRRIETLRSECRYTLIDTAVALNAALFINCAILIIAAAQFWTKGVEVTTLTKAYHLLENTGFKIGKLDLAPILFGVALIASGQSSTLCGTLAGQYVMEGFLNFSAPPIVRRLVTRLVAIVPALVVISSLGDAASYQLLIMCQVVLAMQLPFAVVPMIRFTNSKRRMGTFCNSTLVKTLAWSAAIVVVCLNMAYVGHLFGQGLHSPNNTIRICTFAIGIPGVVFLMSFLAWIALRQEKGGPETLYRIEDQHDFELDSLDSFGSALGEQDGRTPLMSLKKGEGESVSPFALDGPGGPPHINEAQNLVPEGNLIGN